MTQKILLLEDDIQFSDTIKQFLVAKGYDVLCVYDGIQAEDLVYEKSIDLMLLDVRVPSQNGFECLKNLRDKGCVVPAIFITSLNSIDDVTEAFDIGCDDYIRKPFALKELLVRIESVLKRRYGLYDDYIDLDDGLRFDIKTNLLSKNNQRVLLKRKETMLLALFLEHTDELLSYEIISERLWNFGENPSAGSLRAYVKTLRSIIGKKKIETIKNIGYRFVKK